MTLLKQKNNIHSWKDSDFVIGSLFFNRSIICLNKGKIRTIIRFLIGIDLGGRGNAVIKEWSLR